MQFISTFKDIFSQIYLDIISYLVIFILGFFLQRIIVYFRSGSDRYFHKIFSKKVDIDIVYPTIKIPEYDPEVVKQKINIPSNVRLMPFAEATGIAQLQTSLERVFKKRKVRLIPSTKVDHNNDVIWIGGPSVNLITREMLTIRNYYEKVELVYPDNIIIDHSKNVSYSSSINSDGKIKEDYGVLIVGKNPMNPQRNIFLFFGIWGQGTNIAINSLIGLKKESRKNEIAKIIKSGKKFCILSKASVYDLEIGKYKIIDIIE